MLKNYFLIAYRTLLRNKEYSLINIFGLAISIASCLLLFYVLRFELSFDTFHTHREKIYRVVTETAYPEGKDYTEGIPAPLPEAMRLDFPQLKSVGTILSIPNSQIDVVGEQREEEVKYREERGVFFAEPQFFSIFDFKWLHGSPATALQEPNTVALSQETAAKYFGHWRNAIGKSIEYENRLTLKVTGILENVPDNSDFPLEVVISFKTRTNDDLTNWGSIANRRQCYILLDEHTSPEQIQALIPAFEKKHNPSDDNVTDHYTLQPLSDIHFDARYGNFNNRTISKTTLLSLAMMGLFLMITASINFVNLAIAQVIKKSKEVGVRKVLGSSRGQLSWQFFGETFLIVIVASAISVVIAQTALPFLRPLLNIPPSFNPVNPSETGLFLLAVSIIITAFSGFYPVHVMTAFKPAQALKSKISSHTVGGMPLRKGLVVVQFVIAQVLIIITLIVLQQLDFFRKAPLGFDKDSILLFSIPTDSVSRTRIESLRNTLLQQPEIKNVSFSYTAPLSRTNRGDSFQFDGSKEDAPFEVNVKYADIEFYKTYDLSLAAGHIYQQSDTARECLVNKTFLKKLGITDPEEGLGKKVTLDGVSLPIVGVLNDFHLHSLQEEIDPLVITTNKREYRNVGIKLDYGKTEDAIQKIGKIHSSFFTENIFEYKFLDENVARQYASEEQLATLTNIFCGIAIFISCLGLYGLISFMAVQRTKEVGVRKVLGATLTDVVMLFWKEFIFLVLIAFVISTPVAWYFMSDWLDTFAYRIDMSLWTFLLAIGLSLIISLVTVSFRSIKAAMANPVDSLRTE